MGTTLENNTSSRKVKSKEFVEDDFSSSDSDKEKTTTAKPTKKTNKKQKPIKKDGAKGFTDNEIRR